MTETDHLNSILKYADIIGKQPNEPQDARIKNAVKIALRIGFNAGKQFKTKSE